MDNLSPTSPLVPGLGGFEVTTIPTGLMSDDYPPTSLKHSNSNSSSSHSSSSGSTRRIPRGHKDRPDSTYAGLSRRDLARMLVEEELRSSHFSKFAQTLSSQLSQQGQPADEASVRAFGATTIPTGHMGDDNPISPTS